MALFIKVISVLFEYGMLICLICFVMRIAKYMWKDLRIMKQQISKKDATNPGEALLTVVQSADKKMMGRCFAFTDEITVGRGADNDIILEDTFVSHHHLVIFQRNNQYIAEDLGSRNHTYLNERQLDGKAYLKSGDLLQIGYYTLRFER